MYIVHGVEDTFVHGLDAVCNMDIAGKLLSLIYAGKAFDFSNEGLALFTGYELGTLHRIHKKLKFRQLKISAGQVIVSSAACSFFFDIHSYGTEGFKIIVDAFALSLYAAKVQFVDDFGHGKTVLIVGFFLHELGQIYEFQFLV